MARNEDLVGPSEIALRLRVAPSTARMWHKRGLLPEPLAIVSGVPVFSWAEVERWARETDRWPQAR